MNIAVVGAGGVGGYFGGKLTQILDIDRKLEIFFVARGQHLKKIQKNGLILDTEEGELICKPTKATENISELPVLDLCLICVKSFDLDEILIPLKKKISVKTMILPLLNGVDIYERIRNIISHGIIFPACAYIGTHIEKNGKVIQRGGTCTIHFGGDPNNNYVDKSIFKLFKKSEIKYNWMNNPYTEIWSKYIFIASFGLVTANFDKTIGEVLESNEFSNYVKLIMGEIVAIAAKKGVILPPSVETDSYEKAKKFPFDTKTSFQRNFKDSKKPDERDLFGGTIIRMGKEYGVSTDMTRQIYDSIQKKKII